LAVKQDAVDTYCPLAYTSTLEMCTKYPNADLGKSGLSRINNLQLKQTVILGILILVGVLAAPVVA